MTKRIILILLVAASVAVAQKQGKRPAKKNAGRKPMQKTVIPENLTRKDYVYRKGASDNRAWQLSVVYDHTDRSIRPGLVIVHGGGWRNGDKEKFMHYAVEYAQKGYICTSVSYRLTDEAPFPAAVHDVKNAVRFFRAHADEYFLDPDHIGAYGNSAGAHLVCMLGLVKPEAGLEGDGTCLDQSSMVQAVAASATPTDFSLFKEEGANSTFLAGPEDTLAERIRKASPISYVRKDTPPFLLFQGTADKLVNVAHGDRFVEALKKAGAMDVTYIRVDGASHGVFGQNKLETHKRMDDFFERTLKRKK
ncbi:MAG: alpha/beta hydrolase [Kiritimatiellales bacterium]|nr:alpha/beta hydrolase [Kiritimatiellales bacterium]